METAAAEDLICSSVRLAAKARDDFWSEFQRDGGKDRRRPLVAASIGCFGASLADGSEFHGSYRLTVTKEELKDFHRRRMILLARAGADVLACETVCAVSLLRVVGLTDSHAATPGALHTRGNGHR